MLPTASLDLAHQHRNPQALAGGLAFQQEPVALRGIAAIAHMLRKRLRREARPEKHRVLPISPASGHLSPIPRLHKRPRPHPPLQRPRLVLLSHIARRILPIRQRMPVPHQPAVHVQVAKKARRQQAAIAVSGVPTRQGRNADLVNERIGRVRAAGIGVPPGVETHMRHFRRIDARQQHPLAGQDERIRVGRAAAKAGRSATVKQASRSPLSYNRYAGYNAANPSTRLGTKFEGRSEL